MFTALQNRFVKQAPFAVMGRVILEFLLRPQDLDELFAEHAQTQYERKLLFGVLTNLLSDVVLRQQPSVLAAYKKYRQQRLLDVSDEAVYQKLRHTELPLIEALVRHTARRARSLLTGLQGGLQPAWVPGYRCRILDGNHLSGTQHRLDALAHTWAAALPGKALVVLDQQSQLVEEVVLCPDGHAQERSLLHRIFPLIAAHDVWIADRNFCTRELLWEIGQRHAYFVMRQHGNFGGQSNGARQYVGRASTGKVYEEAWTVETEGQARTYRRITIELDKPTTDGDTQIHILSNLPATVSALVIAELYLKRWGIEGRFGEVATTLNAEPKTLAYPQAALFAFCLGLVASNAVAVLKGAVASAHGAPAWEMLSAYYLVLEMQQTAAGMAIAVREEEWREIDQADVETLAAWLTETATGIDWSYYKKAPRRAKKKKPPAKQKYQNGGHVSTHKVLQERKQRQSKR
jgi:hypothetical protein